VIEIHAAKCVANVGEVTAVLVENAQSPAVVFKMRKARHESRACRVRLCRNKHINREARYQPLCEITVVQRN
jgi:hypothetical protein